MKQLSAQVENSIRQLQTAVRAAVVGIIVIAYGTANATVTAFDNQADWEAVHSGATFLTETFDGPASSFAANSSGNLAGLVTIDLSNYCRKKIL